MEDQATLHLHSILDRYSHYRLNINKSNALIYLNFTEFLSFVKIAKGSIVLGNRTYFRHQLCPLLTLDGSGNLAVTLVLCPSYVDRQSKEN